MIKALRIGHATFETPDSPRLSITTPRSWGFRWTDVKRSGRFLASKIGQLAIELKGASAMQRAVLRGRGEFRFREIQKALSGMASPRVRTDSIPGLPSPGIPGSKGTTSSCSANGATIGTMSRWSASRRSSSATSPSCRRTRRRWPNSTSSCSASAFRTGSTTSSCSCAASPIITR